MLKEDVTCSAGAAAAALGHDAGEVVAHRTVHHGLPAGDVHLLFGTVWEDIGDGGHGIHFLGISMTRGLTSVGRATAGFRIRRRRGGASDPPRGHAEPRLRQGTRWTASAWRP
ncbi:hypothetical protein ACFFX0_20620 [Citricoccus parietis]|uniref:Uncharacterized protein n=1 Tax=Citricoccus parietis TaxID=592307 RepID=A0ABV5G3G8_9MICC